MLKGNGLCGRLCGGGDGCRRGIWGLRGILLVKRKGGETGWGMDRRRTVGVELEDVDVAVCVCDDYVKLFSICEKVCRDCFDVVWGFAKETDLVRFLLLFLVRSVSKFWGGYLEITP